MPPLEYDALPGVRCPRAMRCQSCMWDFKHMLTSFLIKLDHKFHSIYAQSITIHPARLTREPRISIACTGLKYQNLMEYEYDCMRDSSRRWKNNGFSHIAYYHIPEHFTSEGKKFKKKTIFRFIFFKKNVFGCMRWFFWYTMTFVEYEDLWGCMWSAMGSSGVRWHPRSAMSHEYARPEIPWQMDSGPQSPKFNRADAGCCKLTGFQSIQQTSQTIFWNPLLLQSPKWETHLSGHALAHPGWLACQEQHKASIWCQTFSKLSWKVFPPQPVNSQVWNMSHTGKQVGKTMGPKRQVWSTVDSWIWVTWS